MSERCPTCGAAWSTGATCRDCFDALLAFENERPPAFGAVHHLTVPCYFMQHPAGYALHTLSTWRELLADSLDGRASPRELQARFAHRFDGAKRVRDPDAVLPGWWPSTWPTTVCDVLCATSPLPSTETYVEGARRWAITTRETLDRAERMA
jgi:hypothetical protein